MNMQDRLDTAVCVAPSAKRADDYGLVLEAIRIPHRVEETDAGWAVMVAAADAASARGAIAADDAENRERPAAGAVPGDYGRTWIGAFAAGLLIAFFAITGPSEGDSPWVARGSASAELILKGEAWRAVTALTLHVDAVHLLGNALACAVFVTAVGHWVGPGLGIWLVLLAGSGGNALTALAHGGHHVSVGASTSIFGAVGILAARQFVARRQRPWTRRRAWVAIAAGLALLGMLGTGAGADILGHLFGLLVGCGLGAGAAAALRWPPGPAIQWALALAAGALVVGSWWIVLATGTPP